VLVSKLLTLFLVVAGGITGYYMHSIQQAWELQAAMMAGTGSVFILRWLWWRVNAWSEIAAISSAVGISIILAFTNYSFPVRILISTALCTTIWMTVTMFTAPVSEGKLIAFYCRVHPGGPLWRRISRLAGEGERRKELGRNLAAFVFGTAFTFLSIFGIGEAVFFSTWKGILLLTGAAVSAYIVFLLVRETFRQMQEEVPGNSGAEPGNTQ
jgi:hypothetical protein